MPRAACTEEQSSTAAGRGLPVGALDLLNAVDVLRWARESGETQDEAAWKHGYTGDRIVW